MDFFKNLHPNILALTIVALGIVGWFIRFFLSQRDIKKTLNNEFHTSLVETQRLLKQNPTTTCWKDKNTTHDIITNNIDNHERAFIRLAKSERISLQSTWDKYKKHYDEEKFRSVDIDDERLKRKNALNIIHELLKFAK